MRKNPLLIFLYCFLLVVSCEKHPSDVKPNIIYVLADDLGYGDINIYNSNGKIKTPNIDQLASEGIFTDAHTSSSVCTPTRYGILTGRYNWRSKLKKVFSEELQALIQRIDRR